MNQHWGNLLKAAAVSTLLGVGAELGADSDAVLTSLGYPELAAGQDAAAEKARQARWRLKLATGYDPRTTRIPKRFAEITTWKGPVDAAYMEALRQAYATAILELAKGSEADGRV